MSPLAKHVIRQPKPIRWACIAVASIAITAILVWLYFHQTIDHLHSELQILQQNNQALDSHEQQLEQSNRQLTEKLETQQQFLAIQQATDQQLQLQVTQLQDVVVHLNKELKFYQAVTQGTSTSKLQIRELHLRADEINDNIVHYRVVITQGKKISKPITGTVSLALSSASDNEMTLIGEHALSIRHVQILEGQIKLADNISPDVVTVVLKQNKKGTLSQKFDWQVASSPSR